MKIPEILLIESEHRPGNLGQILTVIGEYGLTVEHLTMVHREGGKSVWEVTLEMDAEADRGVFDKIDALPTAKVLGRSDRVFNRHAGGKIHTVSRVNIESQQVLRDIYTPGVARVCLAIQDDPARAYDWTNLGHTVAIVTNGTAILGLGNIGPVAGLPVMEGKAALFAAFSDITGVPILLDTTDPQEVIRVTAAIAPSFGGIQLEDIAAPECFEIEQALVEQLEIPVLHDDQHGTAVVTLAALLNSCARAGRRPEDSIVGQVGLGAAGIGIVRLLQHAGMKKVMGADLNPQAMERLTAMGGEASSLEQIMAKADIVVATTGVKGLIRREMVRPGQVILALSNPDPEIEPMAAMNAGAAFAADGKGINNVLGFPGLFRGALDARAKCFTDAMLIAAARTLANLAGEHDLVPDPLNRRVHDAVAAAVAAVA
ncbi:MAG: NADP-dependent malic enzyme [Gammaproteobacteria bacterium]|nr:NADP-dependent malic enzyme [Gammaproteobacteria bacterium]NNF61665.1 NAD-dependent malic enzyme [Gammaproteobacteria bacterium]NNM21231.1 NAD-dependent malic enzyme [Gammaproteobacteria bacterium]